LSLTLETIERRVAEVRRARVQYGEVVAWLGRLLAETVKVQDEVRLPAFTLTAERTGEAFVAGRPLFTAAELPLDMELTRRLYAELVKMVDARKAGREQVDGLAKALDADQGDPPKALLAALGMDLAGLTAAGGELGVAPQVLDMLLRLAARPSPRAVSAAALTQVDLESWAQGHCPVCGSPPRLADLSGPGGRRRLHCALCETSWFFRRRHCPFCHNDDPETQEVLISEGEEGYRVDLCLQCGQHVKTLDLRVLEGPVIVWLDDMSTWHLDLAAQRRLEELGAGAAAPETH
jgi:FdhE protein